MLRLRTSAAKRAETARRATLSAAPGARRPIETGAVLATSGRRLAQLAQAHLLFHARYAQQLSQYQLVDVIPYGTWDCTILMDALNEMSVQLIVTWSGKEVVQCKKRSLVSFGLRVRRVSYEAISNSRKNLIL